jgi:hypothetical protein
MRRTLALTLAAIALGLPACSSPSMQPLMVTVTDAATHSPVHAAEVIADVPSKDHPFSVNSIFGLTGPLSNSAFTDERGIATVNYATGRPVRITVLAPLYSPVIQLLEEPIADADLTDDFDPPDQPRLIVHIKPPTTASAATDR